MSNFGDLICIENGRNGPLMSSAAENGGGKSMVKIPDNPVRLGCFLWGIDAISGTSVLLSSSDNSNSSDPGNKCFLFLLANSGPPSPHLLIFRPIPPPFPSASHRPLLSSSSRMDLGHCAHLLASAYPAGLPESALWLILKSLLSALDYLHSQGIIHRSVCAANVWLDSSGQIRLTLTRHAIRIADCPKWIGIEDRIHEFTSDMKDLVPWLAPEVLIQDLNGYGVDSDIYSVGICLCELGNGAVPGPFQEMEPLQILFEKLSGSAPVLLDSTNCQEEIEHSRTFSRELHDFLGEVLDRDRPSASQLLRKYQKFFYSEFPPDRVLSACLPLAKRIV